MKKQVLIISVALVLFFVSFFSGCIQQGSDQPGENLPSNEDESGIYKIQLPIPKPGSDSVELTVEVVDCSGQFVEDAIVSFSPKIVSFMIGAFGTENTPDLAQDLFVNTRPIPLFPAWGVAEEKDDNFSFEWMLVDEYPYLSIEAGTFSNPGWEEWLPGHIDPSNNSQLKEEYLEYLSSFATFLSSRPEFFPVYMVNPDVVRSEGNLSWTAEEISTLRQANPNAIIGLALSHEGEANLTDEEILIIEEFNDTIDVIGMEYHPGTYSPSDIDAMSSFYHELAKYGKFIHIWETYVPSDASTFHSGDAYVPDIGFSEDNQAVLLKSIVQIAVENPSIMGVCFLNWQDELRGDINDDGIPDEAFFQGLLRENGSPKPAYYDIQEYLLSAYTPDPGITDSQGTLHLNILRGDYELTVVSDEVNVTKNVIIRNSKIIQVELCNNK